MSAPSRGRGGTTATRAATSTPHGRGTYRGNTSNTGRGRGRGRAGNASAASAGNNAGGLLQKLRSGTVQRTPDDGATPNHRGRSITRGQSTPRASRARGNIPKNTTTPRSTPPPPTSSPAPHPSHKDFMAQMNERFQLLKPERDAERKRAIQDGFLADPDKKTSLANAITPVGTCTDMCPQFERVERIVQNMVDRTEKTSNESTGRDVPSEERMVKRFRRSAAGYDEQLPSDIRTPETLQRTLDYLLDKVVGGGERLASIHKFVWDRTRGIRNDFSIQQVTKKGAVEIAIACYERIARFHILSLHQLSNPNNLQEGEHFDAHQEREQLNNTLLSLMYYYDDNRGRIALPHEAEFRSYCILFELQTLHPDLEDRMQAWPVELLNHPKVQTAFQLYAAAGNTIMDQGPLKPTTPFMVAQANSGKFWNILSSQAVSYVTACVAEMNFNIVRFTALEALWRSAKSSPQGQQARNQDWTLSELQTYLAFDDEDETLEFCQAFDLAFKNNDDGEQCLDFSAVAATSLDRTLVPMQQVFSHGIVEEKRYKRTLVAVINGVGVAAAIRQGLVVESSLDDNEEQQDISADDQSMFIPEQTTEQRGSFVSTFGSDLNPAASSFTPASIFGQSGTPQTNQQSLFGQTFAQDSRSSVSSPVFGSGNVSPTSMPQPSLAQPVGNNPPQNAMIAQQPATSSSFGLGTRNATSQFPTFGLTNTSQPTSQPTANASANVITSTTGPTLGPTRSGSESVDRRTSPFSGFGGIGVTPSSRQLSTSDSPFGLTVPKAPEVSVGQPEPPRSDSTFGQGQQKDKQLDGNGTESQLFGPPAIPSFIPNKPESKQPGPVAQQSVSPPQETTSLQQTSAVPKQSIFSFTPAAQLPETGQAQQTNPAKPSSSTFDFLNVTETPKLPTSQTPLFSFTPPSQTPKTILSAPQQIFKPLPSPLLEPSTTPQGTPRRRQQDSAQHPSAGDLKSASNKSQSPSPGITTSDQQRSSTSPHGSQTSAHFTPPHPSLPLPSESKFTQAHRVKLIENTSRLILTQPQGLIEYFVSHHVSNLLQALVKQYLQEQHDQVITFVRNRHLSRKFFAIWRENTQRNVLNKRAKQRRKLLAAAMQAEQDRKHRDEAELEAILAATKETKRLQEEQRQLSHVGHSSTKQPLPNQQPQTQMKTAQVVGQKRKTASGSGSPRSASGTPQRIMSSHKRSRTLGTISEPSASTRHLSPDNTFRTSHSSFGSSRLGQSFAGRLGGSTDLRRSITQKMDSTKTDYFKLKALGIDPNTPLIPDTARSLRDRRNKELEAKEAFVAKSTTRPSLLSTSTSRQSSPTIHPPQNRRPGSPQSPVSQSFQAQTKAPTLKPVPQDDPFLRQLREARQSLAQDAAWFKTQVTVLEKEIEEHEQLRRSQDSETGSRPESPQVLVNGLAKVNGYGYYPAENKPGTAMSRTEERIRRTGAHGLATRPIGRDYVPVAMSRQSASRYSRDTSDEASYTSNRRGRGESNRSSEFRTNTVDHGGRNTVPLANRAKDTNQYQRGKSNIAIGKSSLNAFAALQTHSVEDEQDEEEQEHEDDMEHNYHNAVNGGDGADGDTEDNDGDLFEEDNGNHAEDDEDADEGAAHRYPVLGHVSDGARVRNNEEDDDYYVGEEEDEEDGEDNDDDDDEEDEGEEEEEEEGGDEEDDGTPGTQPYYSRAQSGSSTGTGFQTGPGASADDALVLSD